MRTLIMLLSCVHTRYLEVDIIHRAVATYPNSELFGFWFERAVASYNISDKSLSRPVERVIAEVLRRHRQS